MQDPLKEFFSFTLDMAAQVAATVCLIIVLLTITSHKEALAPNLYLALLVISGSAVILSLQLALVALRLREIKRG